MQNIKEKFNKKLWSPVIPYHPTPSKTYRTSKTESFLDYQPVSERYEVPGLLPKTKTRKKKNNSKPY